MTTEAQWQARLVEVEEMWVATYQNTVEKHEIEVANLKNQIASLERRLAAANEDLTIATMANRIAKEKADRNGWEL